VSEVLRMQGCEVLAEADGGSAVVRAASDPMPDAAFIDLGMPGVDGYEVARRLRADPRTSRMKLVALSGYGGADVEHRTREAGFDAHVVKPASPATLLEAMGLPATAAA
jgi:CheY-like chemotaxis protein